jgi:hypothetical protein
VRELRSGRVAGARSAAPRSAIATPWFEWLNPSPADLAEIAEPTGWAVERVSRYDDEPGAFAAVLRYGG